MTEQQREAIGANNTARDHRQEQEVIQQTGDAGVVETHGGATSLGTTPIGLGSVGPVQQHQQATDMIMGQTDASGGAPTTADISTQELQARGAVSRPGGQDAAAASPQPAVRLVKVSPPAAEHSPPIPQSAVRPVKETLPATTRRRTILRELVLMMVALLTPPITLFLITRRRRNRSGGVRLLAQARAATPFR